MPNKKFRKLERNCPQCNNLLIYSDRSGFNKAIKYNKLCNFCANQNKATDPKICKKISIKLNRYWHSGRSRKFVKRSLLHGEISDILVTLDHWIVDEWGVDGKYFDIYIVDRNILLEINGTYWHLDPRFYDESATFKTHGPAKEKWKYDHDKKLLAESRGYRHIVIWEYDWTIEKDKIKFLKNILK